MGIGALTARNAILTAMTPLHYFAVLDNIILYPYSRIMKSPSESAVSRPRGRPAKHPTEGKRIPLGLRVTAQIKQRLDDAAAKNGRSQSQEAELRLERSFERQDLLPETLALAFGQEAGGLLMAAGMVMTTVGSDAGRDLSRKTRTEPRNWIDDPYAFDQALRAMIDMLDRARPPGDPATDAIRRLRSDARPIIYAGELAMAIDGTGKSAWADAFFEERNIQAIRSMLGKVALRLRLDGYNFGGKKDGDRS